MFHVEHTVSFVDSILILSFHVEQTCWHQSQKEAGERMRWHLFSVCST